MSVSPINVAFKGSFPPPPATATNNSSDKVADALKENTNTAKICAYTALATSAATLIPLTILAVKTGKISKIAEDIRQPIINSAEKASELINTATGIVRPIKNATEALAGKTTEVLDTIKPEKLKDGIDGIFTSVQTAINKLSNDIDGKKLNENLQGGVTELRAKLGSILNTVQDMANTVNNKAKEVDVQKLNETLQGTVSDLRAKLDKLNIDGSNKAVLELIKQIKAKVAALDININLS